VADPRVKRNRRKRTSGDQKYNVPAKNQPSTQTVKEKAPERNLIGSSGNIRILVIQNWKRKMVSKKGELNR